MVSMPSQNTLDLAKQGDAEAIATILTYHLTQRYNTAASVLRLGNYLSILMEASCSTDQATMVPIVRDIIQSLGVEGISIIEVSARRFGDREVLWSQTIEIPTESTPPSLAMTPDPSISANLTDPSLTVESPVQSNISPDTSGEQPQTSPDEWDITIQNLIQRPEMLALITFALILVLWDTYSEWLAEVDPGQPLSGVKLARRLGVNSSTISRYKLRPNFSQWSQDLDPDGIAWSYDGKFFVPHA
jgi:hypothetical protein